MRCDTDNAVVVETQKIESEAGLMGDQDGFDVEHVKKELNNIIWMYGHPDLTLKRAEEIACEMLVKMRQPSA